MKKKSFTIIFCLFIACYSFGQSNGLLIEYLQVIDTEKAVEMKGYLYALPSEAIYEELLETRRPLSEKVEKNENEIVEVYQPLINDNKIFIVDINNKDVEYFEYLKSSKKSKITDEFSIKWTTINEKKMINDIECYKATTDFRGRKWEAWYAPSIPYSFGPWKFYGLPGLIISIHDESKRYNFAVKKIENLKENIYNDKLKHFKSIKYDVQQTLKEFVLEREKIVESSFSGRTIERGKEIIREKRQRSGRELIYEWEEQSEK
ncbi:GLPGLI family protein [Paenimyroides aestuarii]|uniref:GLPGLI family protein n=1 Tax=Paenimyroides aestuarii TaxID=2968490 RepID=A0ABY5NR10_9FLAO|nr:GLPGLI family protein [Paenimyroides aestuarii]UUV20985.1 GLPGLI family protein [Paenimyroides aestuarii]